MPPKTQTAIIGLSIIFAVAALLGVANLWTDEHRCAWEFPKAIGCILAVREGLAGGIIGAGGALFAGWLAWAGVRDQVQTERDLATAKERANFNAIIIEMKDLLETLNQIWRAIDAALLRDQTAEQQRLRVVVANSIMNVLPDNEPLKLLKNLTDALAVQLDPIKRGQFIRVWHAIDWIYGAKRDQDGEGGGPIHRLQLIRIHLSHLERYLWAFDPQTALQFAGRQKANVDHRGMAEQIRPMVDKAERGEPL
jgi:hypothetical protein